MSVRRNGYILKPLPKANGLAFTDGYAVAARARLITKIRFINECFQRINNHAGHVRLCQDTVYLSPLGGFVLSCIERGQLWLIYANWVRRLAEYDSVGGFF